MTNTIHVTARLPTDLVERLQRHAERSDRTLTATIRRVLEAGIESAEIEERVAAMSEAELDAVLAAAGIGAGSTSARDGSAQANA